MAGEYIEFHNNSQPALNETNVNRMQQLIKQDIQATVSGDTLPVGAIMPFGSDTVPDNWLLCDGSAVSREDYQQLFNTIGTTFGQGDGFTTFNLPDLRDRVPIGKDTTDTDFNTLGKTAGEREHTLTIEEMPSHIHNEQFGDRAWIDTNGTGDAVQGNQATYYGSDTAATNQTASTGEGQPHNITQPSIAINYIIKAQQSAGVVATVVDNLNSLSATNALSANQGRELAKRMSYSAEEKIIGEWVDGRVIYEKTLIGTKLPGTDLRLLISNNIYEAFVFDGFIKTISGVIYDLNRYEDSNIFTRYEINPEDNEFIFKSSAGDYTNGIVVATIRYTKNETNE